MEELYSEVFKERFGKLLNICKENNIQQQDIAKALGVSKQTLTAWKNGNRSPRMPMIKQMAEYFRIPVGFFTGAEDDSILGQLSLYETLGLSPDDWQDVDTMQKQLSKSVKRIQLENLINSASEDQLDLLIKLVQAVVNQRKP